MSSVFFLRQGVDNGSPLVPFIDLYIYSNLTWQPKRPHVHPLSLSLSPSPSNECMCICKCFFGWKNCFPWPCSNAGQELSTPVVPLQESAWIGQLHVLKRTISLRCQPKNRRWFMIVGYPMLFQFLGRPQSSLAASLLPPVPSHRLSGVPCREQNPRHLKGTFRGPAQIQPGLSVSYVIFTCLLQAKAHVPV